MTESEETLPTIFQPHAEGDLMIGPDGEVYRWLADVQHWERTGTSTSPQPWKVLRRGAGGQQ